MKEKEFYGLDVDRVFKAVILGDKDHKFLSKLLEDILEEEIIVEEVDISEIPIENVKDRVQIVDVLARTKDNRIINVEVNTNFSPVNKERNIMYYYLLCLRKYRKQNEKIGEIIQVNLNHNRIGKRLKEDIRMMEKESNEIYYEGFRIVNVNIAKYKRMCYDKNIKGYKEKIFIITLGSNRKELEELGKRDEIVKEVGDIVFELNEDERERRRIELERDADIIVKKEKEIAVEKSIKKEKVSTAKELLKIGLPLDKIANVTKLSIDEIKSLM